MTSDALKKTSADGYQAMAGDAGREADAQEWIEALNQDALVAIDVDAPKPYGGLNSTQPPLTSLKTESEKPGLP